MNVVGILGDGGQADEVESYLSSEYTVKFRAVDIEYINKENLINIENPDEEYLDLPVISAVGTPALRRDFVSRWPNKKYFTCISKDAVISSLASIGVGCIVGPSAVVSVNVKISSHTIVNYGATIGHNSQIGSFVTISPGVNIAGNVVIEDGAFIGIGASIINKVSIASGVVIGAGAVVVDDIDEENTVWVGVPAKKIKHNNGWLNEV